MLVVQDCRDGVGFVVSEVGTERVGSQCSAGAQTAGVYQPPRRVHREAGLVGDALGIGVGIFFATPARFPSGPENYGRSIGDLAVARSPFLQVRDRERLVRIGGSLVPDVDLHCGEEEVRRIELVGCEAAFLEVCGCAPMRARVLTFLDVLEVVAVVCDGGRCVESELGVAWKNRCRRRVVHV